MSAENIYQESTAARKRCTKQIQKFLHSTGLDTEELARQSGIPASTIRRILNGKQEVTIDFVYMVALYAKRPPEHFFVGEPSDKDKAFLERVCTQVQKIPEDKRAQFFQIVLAFCDAVEPPKSDELV